MINVVGLTTGLAACLLIGVYIQHELSYDKFNEKADRIVRVTMEYSNAGTVNKTATTGTKVGPEFKRVFPSVEEFARTFLSQGIIKKEEKVFDEQRILFADPGVLKIFSFKLIKGDRNSALDAPDKIVLTRSMAKKYFGKDDPINKTITAFGRDLTVSAICNDVPAQSQVKFDFITQFANLGNNVKEEKWWEANWITYLLLRNKENIPLLQQQVSAYMKTGEIRQQARLDGSDYLDYHLEPLTKVHLHSGLAGFEPNGNMTYIYMFGVIAILILVIASANYTNLATAQSTGRGNEIGMRKVLGASKKQVFFQFIGESAVISFLSAALSLCLCIYMIPFFNEVTGKSFTPAILLRPAPIILLAAFAVLVSFFAGFYPAMILSGTRVISVLKKGFRITGGSGMLRRALIVIQFSISVFLVIYTVIIWQQMQFMQIKNLGYEKEHIAILPIGGKMLRDFKSIKESIQLVPGVESVTAAYETPEFVEWSDGITVSDEDGKREISLRAMPVDLDFTKTLKMQLLAGRDFTETDFALMDTSNDYAGFRLPYIINEALAKKIGWTPQQAIGKTIEKGFAGPVVGVVKDFNFSSLKEPIGPMLIFLGRDFSRSFMVRINSNDLKPTLGRLEMLWKQRVPDRPFNFHFLDEDYDKLYTGEKRSAALFTVAASLAIILACLGLFGLAAFSTEQRTKEIGIRRVLGARLVDITILFSKNFLLMVSIAILIAVPAAWYAGNSWLTDFAYRVHVGWWVFAFAALGIASLALITVGWHVIKAAIANPVKSLRTE
jgi:putative ABC transport system permease protein